MTLSDPAFEARLKAAVLAVQANGAFAAEITAKVDDFFARHPELVRTRGAELMATITIFERLTASSEPSSQTP